MKKTLGIRDIATFVYSSGDLTREFFSNRDLQKGNEAHDYLQGKYNENSIKEFFIKQEVSFENHSLVVQGFIDGVLNIDGEIIIEEIKSTNLELEVLTLDYHQEYLAQLKLYGYLYALQNNMSEIHLRLTYISLVDYQVKSFDNIATADELENFFFKSLDKYIGWLILVEDNLNNKVNSIKEIKFPYESMRVGQRDLMKACFQTMKTNDILYAVAPTGIGKTIATIFSSLKAMENKEDKLFYLTAKGMGKSVAINTMKLLEEKGLVMKSIVLTAKTKCCLLHMSHCDSDNCIYAKGYFNRLKDATIDIFQENNIFSFEIIQEYAFKHQICSFEFSLYLSYFCDLIIADYNYVFDPRAHLVRYFEDDTYNPKLLIDEAHNLISRSKDMYSATCSSKNLRLLRRYTTGIKPSIRSDVNKALELIEAYNEKMPINQSFYDNALDNDLIAQMRRIATKCDQLFSDNKEFKHREEATEEYFTILDFIRISEYFGPSHRFLVKKEDDDYMFTILCLDASKFILDTIKTKCHGSVFFSATLYPINYHMDLLTQGEGKYIILNSSFDNKNLDLIINDKVSTKYRNRESSVDEIIETIDALISGKPGNYIIFFPSYSYMKLVLDNMEATDYKILIQKSNMTEEERNQYFNEFLDNTTSKIGFFVMGGVFSEGLDYVGDLLSGVIVVGVGLPQVCLENDLIKEYFEENEQNGFDYAYTFPGFNKVVQAAGRVIRSETDRGVVILMDERFKYQIYQSLMPSNWNNRKIINSSFVLKRDILEFWENKEED